MTGGYRGAGLDVTDPEPLPKGHPLWSMENVVITPHYGGVHPGYEEEAFHVFWPTWAVGARASRWKTSWTRMQATDGRRPPGSVRRAPAHEHASPEC